MLRIEFRQPKGAEYASQHLLVYKTSQTWEFPRRSRKVAGNTHGDDQIPFNDQSSALLHDLNPANCIDEKKLQSGRFRANSP
jgi:hypothetical protein